MERISRSPVSHSVMLSNDTDNHCPAQHVNTGGRVEVVVVLPWYRVVVVL